MLSCFRLRDESKSPVNRNSAAPKTSMAKNVLFKAALLVFMCLQNAALNLVARYSRVVALSGDNSDGYAKTTLVLVCEAVKVMVAFAFYTIAERDTLVLEPKLFTFPVREAAQQLIATTLQQPLEVAKLMVPSLLYVVQNNLVLVAAENLEGPVLAIFAQLKILTTAFFSVVVLKKKLGSQQYIALAMLFLGVCCVQLSQMQGASTDAEPEAHPEAETFEISADAEALEQPQEIEGVTGDGGVKNWVVGVQAELGAVCISGFAGVYFEKVLKESEISVWVRNVHLGLFGIVLAGLAIRATPNDVNLVKTNGFFGGYNSIVWSLVMIQAFGGLLVAAVVKVSFQLNCTAMPRNLPLSDQS